MSLHQKMLAARDNADRMVDMCRKNFDGGAVSQIVAGSASAITGLGTRGTMESAEQYRHFHGHQYTAITAIAKRIAAQRVCVANTALGTPRTTKAFGDSVEALDSHPLLSLFSSPNALMTSWQLMYSVVCSLELTGKAYLFRTQGDAGQDEIWPLPCTWVRAADPLRRSWIIRPFGQAQEIPIPGREIGFFSLPDPSNPFDSVSPLQSQSKAVSTDEQIQTAQYKAFENGIHPGVILTAGRMRDANGRDTLARPVLTETQRTQLITAITNAWGGVRRYGHPAIIDGMIESVHRLNNAPAEMDFQNSGMQTRGRIFQAFGVNPLMVGEIEGANRAQAVVAEESFLANVVNPIVSMMSQVLTRWCGPLFARAGESLVVWIEQAKARDPEQRLAEWKVGATIGAVTPNEYRRNILNLPDIQGGDVPVAPKPLTMPAGAKALTITDPALNPYTLKSLRDARQ